MGFDMEAMLRLATVPAEMLPEGVEREPLSEGLKYEDLMALIRRLEDSPWGNMAQPDVFEESRREGETRAQAKSRVMLEEYSRQGFTIRDGDLWRLRAQYVWVKQYVQGRGEGLPYNTHNWVHFYNRYGMGGQDPVLMIGLRKSTVEEMGRRSIIESQSIWAMCVLGQEYEG